MSPHIRRSLTVAHLLLWMLVPAIVCAQAIGSVENRKPHPEYGFLSKPTSVVKLSNGIRVEHFLEGTGKRPSALDKVIVHYLARLPDATVFDSSYARNEPATFPIKDVIACWTQAVQQMREGGAARFGCPAHTAYGKTGVPGSVPPNSPIFFDVELLRVFR